MTKWVLFTALFLLVAESVSAEDKSVAQQVEEALLPLPEELRADATVIGYDASGNKVQLREGNGDIVCTADSPAAGFSVRCYPQSIEGYVTRVMELLAEGRSEDELKDIIGAEVKAGKLQAPSNAASYAIRGAELQNALPLTTFYVPGATSASTGLTTIPNHYRPWLMFAGTPMAHIMIPGK
jgi:hypothetical protein